MVGLIVPFSGPSSDFGNPRLNGVQLAVDEINAVGGYLGRPLELVIQDDQGNPDIGLKGSQALAAAGVVATIGFCNTGVAAKALERPDLLQYPQIFILNVREFTPKQLANLENYVKEGGGVAFFLGPQVSPGYYNKSLFEKAGITAAPTDYAGLVAAADKLVAAGITPIQFGGTVNWHVMRLLDNLIEAKCGVDVRDQLFAKAANWGRTACVNDAFTPSLIHTRRGRRGN